MGKNDKKDSDQWRKYKEWKAQQIISKVKERDRIDQQDKNDKFKFWKQKLQPEVTTPKVLPPPTEARRRFSLPNPFPKTMTLTMTKPKSKAKTKGKKKGAETKAATPATETTTPTPPIADTKPTATTTAATTPKPASDDAVSAAERKKGLEKIMFWKPTPAPSTPDTTSSAIVTTTTTTTTMATTPKPADGAVAATDGKKGLDKIKFWKHSDQPDTVVMMNDFKKQQAQRKPNVYKESWRERMSTKIRRGAPRFNVLNCKLCSVIVMICVVILVIILLPIVLKAAKLAL